MAGDVCKATPFAPSPASSPFFFQPGFLSSLKLFDITERLGGLQSTGRKQSDTTERLHFHFDEDGFICVCFNSVICVVIFDGHLALSGHHVV